MTYDAILSLRGWGAAEFRRVEPDFLAAARFAVYAERVAPAYRNAHEILDMDTPPGDMKARGEIAKAKIRAAEVLADLRTDLMPDD